MSVSNLKISTSKVIYNFGCGDNRISGAINVDINDALKPDVVMNFLEPLPLASNSVDVIYFLHVIEHIHKDRHLQLLQEFWRVLKPEGWIYFAYPEFVKCATNYIRNAQGMRDFWEATIYGRQSSPFDFHVALMHTRRFKYFIERIGFRVLAISDEKSQPFNTILLASKSIAPLSNVEQMRQELESNA